MAYYLRFETADNKVVYVEVDGSAPSGSASIKKAGVKDVVNQVVLGTQMLYEDALKAALNVNVEALLLAISAMKTKPNEFTVKFGLKLSGEIGNFIISKTGGEANYEITLNWK